MGTVTILNNTNVPINSCISAGFNYSWVNKLPPKQFYVHNGAAGVYTLSTRYWLGAPSEFDAGAATIGLFVGGLVIGLLGLVLVPLTGGASLIGAGATVAELGVGVAATEAAMAAQGASAAAAMGVSTAVSVVGVAISGIAIGVPDFTNDPSRWTSIQAINDRKFIAEARVGLATDEATGVVTMAPIPQIQLREVGDKEFQSLINVKDGFIEYRSDGEAPLDIQNYLSKNDLQASKLLSCDLQIRPKVAGDAGWEIENDRPGALQLWSRGFEPKAYWQIEVADWGKDQKNTPPVQLFTIRNVGLNLCATVENGRIVSGVPSVGAENQLFYIARSAQCLVFKSYVSGDLIIPENGNWGNSTKLVSANEYAPNPSRALWRVTKILTQREMAEAVKRQMDTMIGPRPGLR